MRSYPSSSSWRLSRLVLGTSVVLLAMACSEPQFSLPTAATDTDSTTTTATTTTDTTGGPLTFTGTLALRGQRFYSFTVSTTRTVRITLERLQTLTETPSTATLALGFGVPSGTGCALSRSIAAAASEEPHFNESLAAGVYCTQLADPGNLIEPVEFSVRIEFP
jgi:hypothetical protein